MWSTLLQIGIQIAVFGIFTTVSYCSPVKTSYLIVPAYVTLDSLYSSLEYFLNVFSVKYLSNKSLITFRSTSRRRPFTVSARYTYFLFVYILEIIFRAMTYNFFGPYLPLLTSAFAIPFIRNEIREHEYYLEYEDRVYRLVYKQCKRILYATFASLLNVTCEATLQIQAQISRKEVACIFSNIDLLSLMNFIRIFVFANIMKSFEPSPENRPTVKTFGKGLVGSALKALYNSKQLLDIRDSQRYQDIFADVDDPAGKIRMIINKRKLDALANPHTLIQLLKLFEKKSDTSFTEVLNKHSAYLSGLITRFGSLLMVATLYNQPFIIFPLAALIAFVSRLNIRHISYRGLGFCVALYSGSTTMGLIVSEFFELLENPVTYFCITSLRKKAGLLGVTLQSSESYQLGQQLLGIGGYVYIVSHIPLSWYLRGPLLIAPSFMLRGSGTYFLYATINIAGLCSNYSLGHIMTLDGIIFLSINLFHCLQLSDKVNEYSLINSYYESPENPTHRLNHDIELLPLKRALSFVRKELQAANHESDIRIVDDEDFLVIEADEPNRRTRLYSAGICMQEDYGAQEPSLPVDPKVNKLYSGFVLAEDYSGSKNVIATIKLLE